MKIPHANIVDLKWGCSEKKKKLGGLMDMEFLGPLEIPCPSIPPGRGIEKGFNKKLWIFQGWKKSCGNSIIV